MIWKAAEAAAPAAEAAVEEAVEEAAAEVLKFKRRHGKAGKG